jgi:aspartate/methionine/tyrosine aminotransferase
MAPPQPARRLAAFGESQIRRFTRLAEEMQAINLGQGMPDFDPPAELLEALRQSSAHQYTFTWGDGALREALADRTAAAWGAAVDPDREVTVTCGVTEALVAAVFATVDPGDEVVVIEPMHENYVPAILMAGATPRVCTLRAPDYRLDADALRAATGARTRALILNTPHNPAGRVFDGDELAAVAALCARHGLVLITDEIYADIVYDGRRHLAPAARPDLRERTIAIAGLGKALSATGWRLGYAVAPPALTDALRKVHEYLVICAPAPLQEAAARALPRLGAHMRGVAAGYQRRRDVLLAELTAAGFGVPRVEGAYYVLADFAPLAARMGAPQTSSEAAEWLIRHARVAAIPGQSFYAADVEGARTLLRFAFCKREETLLAAGRRLREALV